MAARSTTIRYGVSLFATTAAVAVGAIPGLGMGQVLALFAAIFVGAWYGGLGPGLAATGVIAGLGLMHLWTTFGLSPPRDAVYGLLLFATVGPAVSLLMEALHAARRRAERRGEWLRVTLSSIGDAVIATDERGRVEFLNGVAESLTGWPMNEARDRPLEEIFRIVREQDGEPADDPVARVLREGVVLGLANHTLLVSRDGARRPIADSAAPIRDGTGSLIGVVLVFRDITEQRQAERERERLRAAERAALERTQAVLDGIVDSYFRLDRQWRFVEVNRQAELIFGRTRDELLGKVVWEEYPGSTGGESYRRFHRAMERGVPDHFEAESSITDGWFEVHVYPTGDGLDIHFGNITDRKRSERQLREARDAAEAANRAKDAFLATLSHELRTPLSPVLASVSGLMADPELPEALRDEVAMIRRNVELEARLIDDLLDLARIAQGKLVLRPEAVDAHALIREAVGICRPEIEAKGLGLTLALEARRPVVRGDAARIQQVVWNLVKNAAKFTPAGGSVAVSTEDGPAGQLVVRVADTGIGIAPERLPAIFDRFEQGGREITRRFGGLGMGLAITRTLVEAHGGRISAGSDGPGRGATFTLELPDAGPPGPSAPEPEPLGRAAGRAGGPLRILVVEDHPDTLRTLSSWLRRTGHDVTTAETAAAAIEAAEAGAFDLLISDLGLPDSSGLELMGRLRPLPGIALSGYGMEEDIERSREAGFAVHLTKPVDLARLETAIRRVVAGQSEIA